MSYEEVKQLGLFIVNITVGEVDSVVLADVDVTWAGEGGEVANVLGLVHRYIADVMTISCEDLDGIRVVLVGWFCFQGTGTLAKIVVDIITMRHACNVKFKKVET